eukprot:CAMPEP_0176044100 /NCGR_PEP_ID=MMETSP0120_2-20121206/21887_1 /TAXON_ID=160619 /ORGANISM="Kryptoperidinium foliaceum, Strain CCMP 1326" /LENGTH=282 /DNA_ID=CAMNT_0017377507 /DNA_START=52 /DNA_END=901 /DNA_ORIENTATION=-
MFRQRNATVAHADYPRRAFADLSAYGGFIPHGDAALSHLSLVQQRGLRDLRDSHGLAALRTRNTAEPRKDDGQRATDDRVPSPRCLVIRLCTPPPSGRRRGASCPALPSLGPPEDTTHLHALVGATHVLDHPAVLHVALEAQLVPRLHVAEACGQDLALPCGFQEHGLPADLVASPHLLVADMEDVEARGRQGGHCLEAAAQLVAGVFDALPGLGAARGAGDERAVAHGPQELLMVLRPLQEPLAAEFGVFSVAKAAGCEAPSNIGAMAVKICGSRSDPPRA